MPRVRSKAVRRAGVCALAVSLFARDAAAEEPLEAARWEPGVVPALNYDSDIGAVGSLARFEPGFEPYRFRLEAQLFTSLAIDAAGEAHLPFHDDYVRADVPGLLGDRLRVQAGLSLRELSRSGYFGLGQLAGARVFSDAELEESERARLYHAYDHLSVSADALARLTVVRLPRSGEDARLEWFTGLHGAFHDVTAYAGSALARDLEARGDGTARGGALGALLHGVGTHGVLATDAGLLWDDRDHEVWPTNGSLTELSSRWSAGIGDRLRYARVHFSTRWFAPIFGDALVVGHRTALDLLVGDAPVYELGTLGVLEPIDAIGGSKAVRGVALGRLAGKAKVLANLEARAQAPGFSIASTRAASSATCRPWPSSTGRGRRSISGSVAGCACAGARRSCFARTARGRRRVRRRASTSTSARCSEAARPRTR